MERHLGQFETPLRAARHDPWLRKGAFWGALHRVLLDLADSHPDWVFWPYEALCEDPAAQFSAIATALGWPFHAEAAARVMPDVRTSSRDQGSTRKRSREMASIWRARMSPEAIDAVSGIAAQFVPEGSLGARAPDAGRSSQSW